MGMGHAARVLILGPRGYDYYDYRGKGGKANKKGPRLSALGPRGFSIYLLGIVRTRSQSNDHNVYSLIALHELRML